MGHKVGSTLVKAGTEEIGNGINLDDSRRGKGRKYSIDKEKKRLENGWKLITCGDKGKEMIIMDWGFKP